eukprot:gnl/Chilomastix_cuspidata/276.p3 GENE.gnl/Chilomastix_cuspidata/276~~gnl/Chilomastix_cuspidata/276.p3  ORF type:complete len:244 (-),score=137.78 gnl/Chilomastix_cuspidata/276:383-1114(-)
MGGCGREGMHGHVGGGGGGGEASDRVMNQLLTEIDGMESKKNVFVIGATNRPDILDPALMRPGRLDQLIYIPMPDVESRRAIFSAKMRKVKVSEDVDYYQLALATDGYSGADITEICQRASQFAIRESVERFTRTSRAIAEHKRQVEEDGGEFDDSEAVARAEEEFHQSVLERAHFERAMRESRKSVSAAELSKYDSFKTMFSAAGADGPNAAFTFGGEAPPKEEPATAPGDDDDEEDIAFYQ